MSYLDREREFKLDAAMHEVKKVLDAYDYQTYWLITKLRKIVEEALDEQ